MAELPKIDSEGLRLAKSEGAKRVSSVTRVSRTESWWCESCSVEVYQLRCLPCGKTKRERR
jgi:hypothetical protein